MGIPEFIVKVTMKLRSGRVYNLLEKTPLNEAIDTSGPSTSSNQVENDPEPAPEPESEPVYEVINETNPFGMSESSKKIRRNR